jgi:hypothetical protein
MRIRLEGTIQEIDEAAVLLRQIFCVKKESKPYKNRNSDLYRVYITVEPVSIAKEKDHEPISQDHQ